MQIPPLAGSYALQLLLRAPARLLAGRLGWLDLAAGTYLYLGSAFGTGGLQSRLNHHLRQAAKPHWHVDYLRQAAIISGGWFLEAPYRLECAWSQALASLPGSVVPAPGFGASDCKQGCRAHLIALPSTWNLEIVEAALRSPIPDSEAYRLSKIDYNGGTQQMEDRF